MSRRIRTKMRRQPNQMGLNHHSQYSSTATHFPHSYSIFGSPISIPTRLLPLSHQQKINYVFEEDELLNPSCPIYSLQSDQLQNAKQINLTVAGKISQMNNRIITTLLFLLTMACCFLNKIFKNSFYRANFYTRYTMKEQQYRELASLTKQFKNFQLLIINIQDNQLDAQKIAILKNAIQHLNTCCDNNLVETDLDIEFEQERLKRKRKIVIRNYCYFMKDIEFKEQFGKLINDDGLEIYFIWEDHITKITDRSINKDDEESSKLLTSVLDC